MQVAHSKQKNGFLIRNWFDLCFLITCQPFFHMWTSINLGKQVDIWDAENGFAPEQLRCLGGFGGSGHSPEIGRISRRRRFWSSNTSGGRSGMAWDSEHKLSRYQWRRLSTMWLSSVLHWIYWSDLIFCQHHKSFVCFEVQVQLYLDT